MRTRKTFFFKIHEYDYLEPSRYFRVWVWVVGFAVGAVLLFAGINALVEKSCHSQGAVLRVDDSHYDVWSGCNYLVDGVWIDSDQYGLVILGGRP